jgi:hypothetical protein
MPIAIAASYLTVTRTIAGISLRQCHPLPISDKASGVTGAINKVY